jgi:hypothetical protein
LNTKLHAITDAKGRPLKFFMTEGIMFGRLKDWRSVATR